MSGTGGGDGWAVGGDGWTAPLVLNLFATALHVLRMLSELVLLPTLTMPLKPIVAITPNI